MTVPAVRAIVPTIVHPLVTPPAKNVKMELVSVKPATAPVPLDCAVARVKLAGQISAVVHMTPIVVMAVMSIGMIAAISRRT